MVNKQEPLLSIIVPVFNEESKLPILFKSLNHLLSDSHEIIIVDGGSTDNSITIAKHFDVVLLHSSLGRAQQMNKGAEHARGKWLLFLHADSVLPSDLPDCLHFMRDEHVVWGFFKVNLSGRAWVFRMIERGINWRSSLSSVATGDQGIFVRRSVFLQKGMFPDIALMEDVAFTKRLRKHTKPYIIQSPIVTSSRRWEKKGVLKTVMLMWLLRLGFFMGVPTKYLAKCYR